MKKGRRGADAAPTGRLTQRLECYPHTVEVTGSNPVTPNELRRGVLTKMHTSRRPGIPEARPVKKSPSPAATGRGHTSTENHLRTSCFQVPWDRRAFPWHANRTPGSASRPAGG